MSKIMNSGINDNFYKLKLIISISYQKWKKVVPISTANKINTNNDIKTYQY